MMSLPQLVLVNFQYEYTTRDGRQVSIKPNERYILVAKTNDHWWYVRKDEATKPFFIPAQYITVLPSEYETTQHLSEQDEQDTLKLDFDTAPPMSLEVKINYRKSNEKTDEKDGHRISKFVVPGDPNKYKSTGNEPLVAKAEMGLDPCNFLKDANQKDINQSGLTNSFPLVEGEGAYSFPSPQFPTTYLQNAVTDPSETQSHENTYNDLDEDIQMLIRAGWDPKIWDLNENHIYDSVDLVKDIVTQDTKDDRRNVEVDSALVSPVSPSSTSSAFSPQQSPSFPTDIPCAFSEKVQSIFIYVLL